MNPPSDRPSNDLDLFAFVAASAIEPGYVLIGQRRRVFRRDPNRRGLVVPAAAGEAGMVAQMLNTRHLSIGGTHHVVYGRREGPACSVLVPAATRTLIARWATLRPLHPPAAGQEAS